MPISSLDDCVSGSTAGPFFSKFYSGKAIGLFSDLFLASGIPSSFPHPSLTPYSGESLYYSSGSIWETRPVYGTPIVFGDYALGLPAIPSGKDCYIKCVTTSSPFLANGNIGGEILYDRLWHNYMNHNTNGETTVDSVAFPPRDKNGTSDGENVDVLLVFYNRAALPAGMTTIYPYMTYTNSNGVSGRKGYFVGLTAQRLIPAGSGEDAVALAILDQGDTGVRSIQNFNWAGVGIPSGIEFGLVAIRILDFSPNSIGSSVNTFIPKQGIMAKPPIKINRDSVLSLLSYAPNTGVRISVFGQISFIVA